MSDPKKQPRKKAPPALVVPIPTTQLSAESEAPLPMVQVLDSVFISAYAAARDLLTLQRTGITHILNLSRTQRCPNLFEDQFVYCSLQMQDTPSGDSLAIIGKAVSFIEEVLECGGKVLVHCYMGKSRAPSVVCAYLVRNLHLCPTAAWEVVKTAQPDADPNVGYFAQIQTLYQKQPGLTESL